MAIKNWSTLTSTDPNDYEALGERAFCGPLLSADQTATDEVIEVKDTLCASLHFIPRGNVTNPTYLSIRTAAAGGGTLLTCTESAGALSSGQVRVSQRSGKLEFHADQLGSFLYATYYYRVSNVDEAMIAQMYAALRRQESGTGGGAESYTAGETVVAGPGYISGGLVYQAVPTALTTCCRVWILAGVASGNTATVYRSGTVTPSRAMPVNVTIYAGHNGNVTWFGDSEAAAKLNGTTDNWMPIGHSEDGITLKLNTNQDVKRQ